MIARWFDRHVNPRTAVGGAAVAVVAAALTATALVQNHNVTRDCQTNPLRLVYNPKRLRVVQRCVQITGRVNTVVREHDGDLHIRLHVDPKWLNQANVTRQHGDLVVEFMPTDHYQAPKPGDGLTLTCTLAEDIGHAGWRECHPAWTAKIQGPVVPAQQVPPDHLNES